MDGNPIIIKSLTIHFIQILLLTKGGNYVWYDRSPAGEARR